MNPPSVYEETKPSTQRAIKMSTMVQNMFSPLRATPPPSAGGDQ